jgi:hypothetical protein
MSQNITYYLTSVFTLARLHCRADDARSWSSFRLVPPESLSRAVKPGFAYTCAEQLHRPRLPAVTGAGLTADLQGFRIRPEGWPLLQRRTAALVLRRCIRVGGHFGSDARSARCPARCGQSMRRAQDSALGARRLCMSGGPSPCGALCAPFKTVRESSHEVGGR